MTFKPFLTILGHVIIFFLFTGEIWWRIKQVMTSGIYLLVSSAQGPHLFVTTDSNVIFMYFSYDIYSKLHKIK
jgi:hypothetical protein